MFSVSMMLAGFTSRWTIPMEWAYSRAAATGVIRRTTVAGGRGAPCERKCFFRSPPGTNSMLM